MLAFVGYHFFAEVLEQPNENTLSTNILLFQPLILFDRDLKDHFDLGFRICPASFKIQVVPETKILLYVIDSSFLCENIKQWGYTYI